MRTFKWDPMFDSAAETSTTITWISFPVLLPNFFGKEAIFSLARAVGKPLQLDMATRNQTRRSYARVKVEVNLLQEFPKRIKIVIRRADGEVTEKWVLIKYDYVSKYCTMCKLQGHNEQQCYVLYPKLYSENKEKKEDDSDNKEEAVEKKEGTGEQQQPKENGKGDGQKGEEPKLKATVRGYKGQDTHIWNRIGIKNSFGALQRDGQGEEANNIDKEKEAEANANLGKELKENVGSQSVESDKRKHKDGENTPNNRGLKGKTGISANSGDKG